MRTAEGDSELTTAKAGPDDAATISIFLADDNLIVREGVRALLALEADLTIVGTAADFEELIAGASDLAPQVVVTDIRMPPTFQQEGIEAAHEIRKRHPGTGVVILSQFDDPEYAISLLEEGAAGYAYLLKDRVAEGDQLARAVRTVAAGGSVLDPAIVKAMVDPVKDTGDFRRAGGRAPSPRCRGSPDQGDRSRLADDDDRRRGCRRKALLEARPGRERWWAELPAASPDAPRGHRQP